MSIRLKRAANFNPVIISKRRKTTKVAPTSNDLSNSLSEADGRRLTAEYFTKNSTINLAQSLLGKFLCRRVDGEILKAIIVETEAYVGAEDHASYSFGGRRTESNEPMYMEAGTIFTRFTYGMYYCFNISSRDTGGAVLVRAVEPAEGIEKMCQLRRKHPKAPSQDRFTEKPFQLANGPAKLCIAFSIDSALNKANLLTNPDIWIENSKASYNEDDIVKSTRVGILASNPWADRLLRYYLKNFKSVSKK